MKRTAHAKINLALVVGPLREGGKHEVATVLQRISLADTITISPGEELSVSGFADDTIVTQALQALAALAGAEPGWAVEIEKAIPVAAGLGGGSSDAAAALQLANGLLPVPLVPARLVELASTIGADVPFFLCPGSQVGTGDGTVLAPVDLPSDYTIVLITPRNALKTSTSDVYRAFDARDGPRGFPERREAMFEALGSVGESRDLAELPPNDLASSPLAERLREAGAFRADVSGAGPCVYGLFTDRDRAEAAARELHSEGSAWVASPVGNGDATRPAASTVGT